MWQLAYSVCQRLAVATTKWPRVEYQAALEEIFVRVRLSWNCSKKKGWFTFYLSNIGIILWYAFQTNNSFTFKTFKRKLILLIFNAIFTFSLYTWFNLCKTARITVFSRAMSVKSYHIKSSPKFIPVLPYGWPEPPGTRASSTTRRVAGHGYALLISVL